MSDKKKALPGFLHKVPFWNHQYSAIIKSRDYFRAHADNRVDQASLIHMPTGTGKTGVIAALARGLPEITHTLLLAPRRALRDQMYREIQGEFFSQFGLAVQDLPKSVHCVDKGEFDTSLLNGDTSVVLISTIQKLDYLRKNDKDRFGQLVDRISLVIFDEGHYEPSLSWSLSIREFKCPKILFTATPYRNDFRYFKLDLQNSFSYTFSEAVNDKIIRSIEIIPREKTNPDNFVKEVMHFYDQQFKADTDARILVRCKDRTTVGSD